MSFSKTIVRTLIGISLLASTAMAQEVFWQTNKISVPVTRAGSQTSHATIDFKRVVRTHNYFECGYYQEPEVITRQGTCYDMKCTGGSGRSAEWDAFYSAKKAEKATKLAAAIKGVGKVSAEALVAGGYFDSKPRSWEAFKTQITAAANAGAITPQVKSMVLSTYREDNMAKLGYASGSCTQVPYTCDEVVVVREGQYFPRTCDDPVEQVIDVKRINYTFEVHNSVLLPSENDSIEVSTSGDVNDLFVSNGTYNTYSARVVDNRFNETILEINGTGRRQVNLPFASLQSVNLLPQGPTSAILQVSVLPIALPATNTESLVVEYTVKTCKVGFLGLCGAGWDKKEAFVGKISSGLSSFVAPVSIAKGRKGIKMEVDVKIYKQNSIYHNASPISKTSAVLKMQ